MPWTPTPAHRRFIREFGEKVLNQEAALFIGAGVSRAAGYVDWKALLRQIAEDLGLDVDAEPDLPALAQYHFNEVQTRAKINQAIIEGLTKGAVSTPVHSVLARLPIDTVWTTNYEKLIEQSFESAGRVVEVKLTIANLAQARRGRHVTVYKMHGCATQPENAVLTKEDYELYDKSRRLFTDSLKGDFVEKTLLFLGFSFTDPNVERILAKVREQLDVNLRQHYWITRRPTLDAAPHSPERKKQEYEHRKADHQSKDLKRYGIETVWIEEWSELEELLLALESFVTRKGVLVSGAAADPSPLGKIELDSLSRWIGAALIDAGFNLVSGFGKGIAEQVILGSLESLYSQPVHVRDDRVVVRPFPGVLPAEGRPVAYTHHREDLIARVGAVIVISGNRPAAAGVEPSPGVTEEVTIAKRLGKTIVPIGVTGHVAHQVWTDAMNDLESHGLGAKDKDDLAELGRTGIEPQLIIEKVISILKRAEDVAAGRVV